MASDKRWTEGFYAGVCCALACVAAGDDRNSVLYNEIVDSCGGPDLLRFARREKDIETEGIRAAVAERRRRQRSFAASTPSTLSEKQ